MLSLEAMLSATYNERPEQLPERLLCLDPGNETGWCVFTKGKLTHWGQVITAQDKGGTNGQACMFYWADIVKVINEMKPTMVVMENYRVYGHKLDRHTFSEIPTLRLIGGLDCLCEGMDLPRHYQMAMTAKGFATDERLKNWGLWKEGQRHSRDAIRHGIYYLITH